MVNEPTRRRFVRSTAAAVALGLGGATTASADGRSTGASEFAVRGRKLIETTYEPDVVSVEVRYRSDDLARRGIDAESLTEEIEYDRTAFDGDDPFPDRGSDLTVERWESEIAFEDEWKAYHRKRREEAERGSEAGTLDEDPEENYWSFPVWTYKRNWTISGYVFEKKSPVNVTFDLVSGLSEVTGVLDDAGWTALDWRQGHEKPRWGYNHTEDGFERSTSRGTSKYRLDGGYHAKLWEFVDGKVGMEVHEDTEAPHSVESWADAEDEVKSIFEREGYDTTDDAWSFGNSKGDHNGEPSVVW